MRRPALASGLLALALVAGAGALTSAHADPDPTAPGTPSRAEVDAARAGAAAAGDAVAQVQQRLDAAEARAADAADVAARAAEAFNGARYRVQQARAAQQQADAAAAAAAASLEQQTLQYRAAVLATGTMSADTSTVASYLEADGMEELLQRTSDDATVRSLFAARQRAWSAARHEADATAAAARAATGEARAALAAIAAARTRAADAASAAATTAAAVAAERTRLVAELARLQGISVELAHQREEGLARARAAAREKAAREAAEAAAAAAREKAAREAAQRAAKASGGATPSPGTTNAGDERDDVAPPAPSSSKAAAAIAFARAQIGEPYRWGASGPSAWDCSGLTSAAWAAACLDLPHYSAAQYAAGTPLTVDELQPGDLVFWADGPDPSSIVHVALYIGGGRIIHAPRNGRPVTEDSLYYWRAPDFFARP